MPLDRRRLIGSALFAVAAGPARAETPPGPGAAASRPVGALELAIAAAAPSTPTGLAIARGGRMFVMMPRFTGAEPFTLGEVMPDGAVRPYPDAGDEPAGSEGAPGFAVPRAQRRLRPRRHALGAGCGPARGQGHPGAGRRARSSRSTSRRTGSVGRSPSTRAWPPHSSLNDLRVTVRDGRALAYITIRDRPARGRPRGRPRQRTAWCGGSADHAEHAVGGRPRQLRAAPAGDGAQGRRAAEEPEGGAIGVALSPDGTRRYDAPLMSRHLYADHIRRRSATRHPREAVAAAVRDLGEKGITGGLTTDSKDRVYLESGGR